jgi:hypothetical protein
MAKKKKAKAKKKAKKTTRNSQVTGELGKLAKAVEQALSAAAGSRHISGVRSDIKSSLQRIGTRLQSALSDAQKSEQTKRLKSQARKVVSTGRKQAEVSASKLKNDLSKGIGALSSELAKLAKKVEKS